MQITVEVKLEQRRRVVRRTTRAGADGPGETQRVQIPRGDKGIQKAHGVFGRDVILQPFGKEQCLGPVQAGTMIHACSRPPAGVKVSNYDGLFTQPLAGANRRWSSQFRCRGSRRESAVAQLSTLGYKPAS